MDLATTDRRVGFHADLIGTVDQAAARMPQVKARPDALAMLGKLQAAERRFGRAAANDRTLDEYGDEPNAQQLVDEIERLQGCEYDREILLDASTGLLLVLSLLKPEIERMGCGAQRAVEGFAKAVAEAQS